jgi:hypothetical protein
VVIGIIKTVKEVFTSKDELKAIPIKYLIYTGMGFWLCNWLAGLVSNI